MKNSKLTPLLIIIFFWISIASPLFAYTPSIYLVKSNFSDLPRWHADKHQLALLAFDKSCTEIMYRTPRIYFSNFLEGGKVYQWQTICHAAKALGKTSDDKARQFFETWFTPYAVKTSQYRYGLFTGYYLPVLQGNWHKTKRYQIPVYGLPTDLLEISMTNLNRHTPVSTIIRQVKNRKLYPYPDRAAIENGAINSHAPVILWVDNKIDLFFAQIQGSAEVRMANGHKLLLGYAGHNGRPYLSIGKILVDNQMLDKDTVSMQTIRNWLAKHPTQVNTLLQRNPSYVFFKILNSSDPFGTEHIPLTPQRSLAIDARYVPLGAPIWLNTIIPSNIATHEYKHYRHLLIAQDTGGAIKGSIRGDIYWGAAQQADFLAGNMKSPGEYWILFPKQ